MANFIAKKAIKDTVLKIKIVKNSKLKAISLKTKKISFRRQFWRRNMPRCQRYQVCDSYPNPYSICDCNTPCCCLFCAILFILLTVGIIVLLLYLYKLWGPIEIKIMTPKPPPSPAPGPPPVVHSNGSKNVAFDPFIDFTIETIIANKKTNKKSR